MVAFNFQPEFADDVENRIKRQTIRRFARCKPGDTLQFYTRQRTKQCRKLGEGVCRRITPIKICRTEMFLNGKRLYPGTAVYGTIDDFDNDFARRDGFPGFMEMAEWFLARYGALPFEGWVIEWD